VHAQSTGELISFGFNDRCPQCRNLINNTKRNSERTHTLT